ncbi:MAG: hypothetical protein HY275_12470 [Gemmatimonadetes bacterium]|nr:hypothetical protein [Gemmatimonadota bacterium]
MLQATQTAPKAPAAKTGTQDGGNQTTTIQTTPDGKVIIKTDELPQPVVAPEAGVVVPPPIPYNPNDVPEGAVVISVAFFVCTAATIIFFPLARALARKMDRANALPARAGQDPDAAQRLQRIEHAVDSIALEVERISEGQRFTTKLLAERPESIGAERRLGNG